MLFLNWWCPINIPFDILFWISLWVMQLVLLWRFIIDLLNSQFIAGNDFLREQLSRYPSEAAILKVLTQCQPVCRMEQFCKLKISWLCRSIRFIKKRKYSVMEMLNMSNDLAQTGINNTKNNDDQIDILVLFGPDNPYFDMIHYTALVSLGISIIISVYTLIYLIRTGNGSLSRWKMGQFSFRFQQNDISL